MNIQEYLVYFTSILKLSNSISQDNIAVIINLLLKSKKRRMKRSGIRLYHKELGYILEELEFMNNK